MKDMLELITRFKCSMLTANEYIKLSEIIISHIQKFDPIFEIVNSWGNSASSWTKIEDDFSNFSSIVFQHIYDKEINYKNPTGSKDFLLDSISWAGFSNSYSNTNKSQDGKYTITIRAGGEDGIGFVNVKFPQIGHEKFYQTDTMKKFIEHLLSVVPLLAAYVSTDSLFDQVVDYEKPYDIQIGWLNYFKNIDILKNIPHEISKQATKEGVYFWLDDEVSDISFEKIKLAINVRDMLGDLGYLNIE